MAAVNDGGVFLELVIGQRDISESLKKFSGEFSLTLKLYNLDRKFFNPRIKTVSLLKAERFGGVSGYFTQSVGLDISQIIYEKAFTLGDNHCKKKQKKIKMQQLDKKDKVSKLLKLITDNKI